jgi:predicted kinase
MKTIIVLSGCPGSGKSTLASNLQNHLPSELIQIDTYLNSSYNFSPELYHQSRSLILKHTEDSLKLSNSPYIIIEDTNHLKSLVKPFRRLAKTYECRFLHIILDVSLETAIKRNQNREFQVKNDVITKIYEEIKQETFFKESFVVDSHDIICDKVLEALVEKAKIMKNVRGKVVEIQNMTHIIDCELRKKINFLISSYEGDKKIYAQKLLRKKKDVLENVVSKSKMNYEDTLMIAENELENYEFRL